MTMFNKCIMLEETQLDMGPVHWVTQRKQFIVLTTIHPQTVFSGLGGFMKEVNRELNRRREAAGFLKLRGWQLGHYGIYLWYCGGSGG